MPLKLQRNYALVLPDLGQGRPCKRIYSQKKPNDWLDQVVKFSRFFGENVQLLRKSLDSSSRVENKARTFVETKLLPSVCSVLSETIQRDVDFGKVRRVSPLCITLEACSAGSHGEEFSCGEVPTMKLCVRPFASLRRGKIVVDAILSNPTVLVAQKKDFTWLGIPLSEPTLPSHSSSEEGIDFRTKTQRLAREEAGIRWDSVMRS